MQYQLNDHLVLSAEYSSDAYEPEVDEIGFERDSPFNFGATYRLDNDLDLSLAWMYGSTLAAGVTFNFNAKAPSKYPSGFEPDGVAVVMRPANAARDLGWAQNIETRDALRDQVRTALSDRDIALDAFEIDASRVQLRIRNGEFPNNAQALGRVARLLTALMPPSVEIFEITLVSGSGVNGSRVVLLRSDIEELVDEPDGAWQSFARARILDAHPESASIAEVPERFPRFSYALGPYLETAFFDPAAPVRTDVGLQLGSTLELSPGFLLRGNVRYLIAGNRDELPLSGSALPRVRTDGPRYFQEGDGLTLNRLTAEKYFRPAKDLYGHVSVGYFEPMFGGLSGELLWKQVDSPLALGAELNYAVQREFDQGFGFGDYDIVTGHASAYYALENGFHVQVDAGRYLAGDWGATFGLDREFDNGISIGAFATLTDVSSEDFGEGSFDKGIRVTIPFSALIGRNTTTTVSRVIRTVQRDGGARLYVPGRLYDQVREYHQPELQDEWGRFWR